MFGYRGAADADTVGFLRISDRGYEIVEDRDQATRFGYARPKRARGWARPDKWLKFFNTEPELSPWVFHSVNVYAGQEPAADSAHCGKI